MTGTIRNLIVATLKRLDVAITRSSKLERLEKLNTKGDTIDLLLEFPDQLAEHLLRALRHSKSQLRQDLFVLSQLSLKVNGFFVEFGATNGIDLSNTYILEKEFGWQGILAEPARCWHQALRENRQCHVETDCVWRESNAVLKFDETGLSQLSTISAFKSSDWHKPARAAASQYTVKTISLEDLLDKYSAPRIIDYLSIDTEGTEYEILKAFNFDRYDFRVMTCEHNFSKQREKIFNLLTSKGFVRKLEAYSAFDDWYVKPGLVCSPAASQIHFNR